jgi:hypothetical protein
MVNDVAYFIFILLEFVVGNANKLYGKERKKI